MNVDLLLIKLAQRGVSIEVRGDILRLTPKGGTGDLLADVARFKPAIIELMSPLPQTKADVIVQAQTDNARARFPAYLWAAFPDADRVAIGHCLLKLDKGEEIE